MARKQARSGGAAVEEGGINMTPMIDVVFQMIIFFVTTVDMDRKAFDEKIRLAMSPHGPIVEQRDPRTVTIEVDRHGIAKLARAPVSLPVLQRILQRAVAEYGQTVPVVIRGDARTEHADIRRVMDVAAGTGLWRIKFSAVRERAAPVN